MAARTGSKRKPPLDLQPEDQAPPDTKANVVEIKGENAHYKHLNHGTEGNAAAPVRRLDLKFEMIVDGGILSKLCGIEELPDFWNTDGSVKLLGLSGFTSRADLKGCHFEFGDLELSKITLEDVAVNDFKFNPTSGRAVELKFRVQVKPSDEELVALSKAVMKKAQLYISCNLGVQMAEPPKTDGSQMNLGEDDGGQDDRH